MSAHPISLFGDPAKIWSVPPEDVSRQATASLRGYIYQLHASAAAWLALGPADELYLEVAEDYAELLRDSSMVDDVLRVTQVKDTRESGAVTLNSPDVLVAIEALHRLRVSNSGREARLVFLTTSLAGKERKDPLPSGMAGLIAWEAVASGGGDVEELRAALLQRPLSEELRSFITASSPETLRAELISPIVLSCGAQDWRTLEESNRQALVARRGEFRATSDMAHSAYDAVLREVVACVLGPAQRCLNSSQLHSCLERATSIPVPSSLAVDLLSNCTTRSRTVMAIDELRELAKSLIEAGIPSSIDLLFPLSTGETRDALLNVFSTGPRLTEIKADGPAASALLSELIALPEKKHLILGQPGSGKTHALWRTAKELLAAGEIVPLYLPVGQTSWFELEEMVKDLVPGIELSTLFQDQRVCVFVDGWSELTGATQAGQKRRALRAFGNARLIATAKFADVDDGAFKHWTLDLLSPDKVAHAIMAAAPGEALPPSSVVDLLRLPLLLSIHILSGARSTTTGDLLRQFHDHLMRDLPERFTEVLTAAVAELSLSGTRSFGRLVYELKTRSARLGLTGPVKSLRSLGSILERSGQAVPVHDLYWSWLAGHGLLGGALAERAVSSLQTRESYALAIQAGACATESDVNTTVVDDIVLAASLDRSRSVERPTPTLMEALSNTLVDPRLAVRNRGALAVLESGRSEFFRLALDVLSELGRARVYPHEWKRALRPSALYMQRATLADWLGSPNSSLVLGTVAESGGPEWSPWLEQVAAAGRISWIEAAATALGCCRDVPKWVLPHLDSIIASHAWMLRPAAERRSNIALARFIAVEYERLIESVVEQNSSAWFDLNRVLVSCGDDEVFGLLLAKFPFMRPRAQELLGFAVVERGSPWVARYQQVALTTGATHHHKLAKEFSAEIDDETARIWIAAGHGEAGWRILIERHGEALLPELIEQLPPSFAGLHHIPALAYMRWLPSAPDTLINEIWRRLGSPMQPKAMQDVLNAIARVTPTGIPHIARFMLEQPNALPAYHQRQVFQLYEDWQKRLGVGIHVKSADGIENSFSDWIALQCMMNQWEDHISPEILAFSPELAIDYVVHHLDDKRAASVLKALKEPVAYRAPLLDRMMAVPALAKLVPQVFTDNFDLFPAEALQRCIASADIDQHNLLSRLAATSNPIHYTVHVELLKRVLDAPLNLHDLRYVANTLRAYSREEVLRIIESPLQIRDDSWFWFVRSVEIARGERLINEGGTTRRF